MRAETLRTERCIKIRGIKGRLGQPSACDLVPGEKLCLKKLQGAEEPGVCRNCMAPEVQTVKLQVFG